MKMVFSEYLREISFVKNNYNSIHFMNQQAGEFFVRAMRKKTKMKQGHIFDPEVDVLRVEDEQKIKNILLIDVLVDDFFSQRVVQKNIGHHLMQEIEKNKVLLEKIEEIRGMYISLATELRQSNHFAEYEINIKIENMDSQEILEAMPIELLYKSIALKESLYSKKRAVIEFMKVKEIKDVILILIYPETGLLAGERKGFVSWLSNLGITIIALTNDAIFLNGCQDTDSIHIFDKLNEKILLKQIIQEQSLFVGDSTDLLSKNISVILREETLMNPLETSFMKGFVLEK